MSMALIQWKNSKIIELEDPTLKELADALHATEMDSHLICQVQSVFVLCIRFSLPFKTQ